MYELGQEAGDAETIAEADRMLADLEKKGEKVELQSLLDGPNDARNCFFTIQAGAGGTEAQDWSEMLLRMYLYFFERRGWDVCEVDRQDGEQAGIKNVTLHVKGPYAFGYLRAEAGVHRLVRPSPFNAQGKRQTSFAAVKVVPEFEEADSDLEIPEGGPGLRRLRPRQRPRRAERQQGRHRRPHHPQADRHHRHLLGGAQPAAEQAAGDEHPQEQAGGDGAGQARRRNCEPVVGDMKDNSFGSQIRNYVLDDRRVKDVRTGVETSDVESVLDRGELDEFIDAELRRKKRERKSEP